MGIYSDVALVMNAKGMECLNGTRAVSECECVCTLKTAAHIIRDSFNN